MIRLKNIHSLSDFQRNTKAHINRLKKTGEPAILTINGEAEVVVLSAAAYQKLLADLELAEILNTAHQGTLESLGPRGISPPKTSFPTWSTAPKPPPSP